MPKFLLSIIACFIIFFAKAQAPYLGTAGADGLGQYGYLEKDAVTFTRLFRNSYNNIAYLSARYWITDNNATNGNGKEYIYHVYAGPDWINGIGWQCGGDNDGSKRTTDFMPNNFAPEWVAGSDCYVSVCAKYCDDSYSPTSFDGTSTNGAVGFNERHFKVVDVDTAMHISTVADITNVSGNCQLNNPLNVAGSFIVNPGSITGLSLTNLYLKNIGTAIENIDIPNDALIIYYETSTGTEIFDGNETLAGKLLANWDGNTTDSIFGSSNLSIPINTPVRIYVLLCNYNTPIAVGKNINLQIINDGISLAPALDGFTKLRINPSSISQKVITLPTYFISFTGTKSHTDVELQWVISSNEAIDKFQIQQSTDGIHFTTIANKLGTDYFRQTNKYQYKLNTAAEYFRIIVQNSTGVQKNSTIVRLKNNTKNEYSIVSNPITHSIILQSSQPNNTMHHITLYDVAGKLLFCKNVFLLQGNNTINIPTAIQPQIVILHIKNASQQLAVFKLIKQ
jgi:hypothetical protein